MKKRLLILTIILINFTTTLKSDILEGFCLVELSDLKTAKIAPEDYARFLGKEIKMIVSLDEGLLADISDDVDLSLITGMYGGSLEFRKVESGYFVDDGIDLNYENKIVVGEKPKEVTYSYKNKLFLKDNKITRIFAYVDQTGFSMNSWKFQIDCRDYPYSEDEILQAKSENKQIPKNYSDILKRITEMSNEKKKNDYSLLIEEDFNTALLVNKEEIKIIAYGGYEFFKGVYDRTDNQANTYVQPAEISNSGKMEDYMKESFQTDFDWIYKERNNDQMVISDTRKFIQLINSYIASDSPFSISSITEEFWYAGTFDLVKNQEDLLKIYQKNKLTYCSLMKERNVLEHYNLEFQYKHNDFIDFNRRNNINC